MSGVTRKKIHLPLTGAIIKELRSGDFLLLYGSMYAARDAAHMRMVECLARGDSLPISLKGETLYYMGPSPAPPGYAVGSAGPTTAARMDAYTIPLLEQGLLGMVAKGARSPAIKKAIQEHGAVYLASIGGAGAYVSKRIRESAVVAYGDLGPEAVLRLTVEEFPVIVIHDSYGGDFYEQGKLQFREGKVVQEISSGLRHE